MIREFSEMELWEKFRQGDKDAKNELLTLYFPLVQKIAKHIHKNLPSSVDVEDLVNDGIFGLIDAIERFDESKGFKLETYAAARIRGEIYDRMRVADWVPRALRIKAKRVDKAAMELEKTLERRPTVEELVEETGLSLEEVREVVALVFGQSVVAMDMAVSQESDNMFLYEVVADKKLNTAEAYDSVEVIDLISAAMQHLSSRERSVMVMYYCESLTLQKIGDVMEVTESRVCQIHNKALRIIRDFCMDAF